MDSLEEDEEDEDELSEEVLDELSLLVDAVELLSPEVLSALAGLAGFDDPPSL